MRTAYHPVLWALALFFLCLGFTAKVDLPLAILAMTAAYAFSQTGQQTSWRSLLGEHWSLGFFLLAAATSTLFSMDPRHSLSVQPQLLPALLAYTVICQFVTGWLQQRFLLMTFLASGTLTVSLMLAGIHQASTTDPLEKIRLLGSALFIVPNDVLMLSILAPLTLALGWTSRGALRQLVLGYLLFTLFASALIGSRQSVVVFLFGIILFLTLLNPRWLIPLLLGGTACGILVDGMLGWPLLDKIVAFPRAYVWHSAWLMFLDRPVIGQGPGMFKDLYYPYLEKAGYVLADLPDRRNMPWAHNLYLEQLAERGVIGLLALMALFFSALQKAWKSFKISKLPESKALSAGLLASLGAMILGGIAEETLTRLWVTVLLLSLVGLCTSLRQGSQND